MSRMTENAVVSIDDAAPEKFGAARRKRCERARRKAEGKVAVTIHVDPRYRHAVRTVEAILNTGDGLAVRMLRFLAILNDMLPERRRARARLPKVEPAAAKAVCAEVIGLTGLRAAGYGNRPSAEEWREQPLDPQEDGDHH